MATFYTPSRESSPSAASQSYSISRKSPIVKKRPYLKKGVGQIKFISLTSNRKQEDSTEGGTPYADQQSPIAKNNRKKPEEDDVSDTMSSLKNVYGNTSADLINIEPIVKNDGFSGTTTDSATFAAVPPKYVVRTSEMSRYKMAFIKSTEQITGVAYKKMFS